MTCFCIEPTTRRFFGVVAKLRSSSILTVAAALSGVCVASAQAAPLIEAIDMGVPSDGVRTMPGYRAFVVRINAAPAFKVRRISLSIDDNTPNERPPGNISGAISQVWVDPTGNGQHRQTPGLSLARNLTPDVMNFDTHFLGDSAQIDLLDATEILRPPPSPTYPNPLTPLSDGTFSFFDAFKPNRPLGSVQDTIDTFYFPSLTGVYDIKPAFRTQSVDLAYVVTNSRVGITFNVYSEGSQFGTASSFALIVPEPTWLSSLALTMLFQRRRRSRRDGFAHLHQ